MSAAGASALWLALVLAVVAPVVLALTLSLPAASASAAGFSCRPGARPVVFNFGDSNSDTGGIAAAKGWHISPPEGRAFFHHPTGRFCDGRLIIDFLCEFRPNPPAPDQSILSSRFRFPCLFFRITNEYLFVTMHG
jgi:hypothetical protein